MRSHFDTEELKCLYQIGRPIQLISNIINGHSGITAETAVDFAQAFETSPKFWLDLDSR
ncbi:MAG: hypothetical protein BWY76_00377 [bacterium ADurb.Bin429]|nr:MAG: hypothetical protein BWY76_00377 [bacterium ADurb.Bin429]